MGIFSAVRQLGEALSADEVDSAQPRIMPRNSTTAAKDSEKKKLKIQPRRNTVGGVEVPEPVAGVRG